MIGVIDQQDRSPHADVRLVRVLEQRRIQSALQERGTFAQRKSEPRSLQGVRARHALHGDD